ncbi:MAG: hypothetical protein OXF56_03410 [Rhodobacteraceae bacterium]|nr:hypothetical protein [Paracoccaceae bacterium]
MIDVLCAPLPGGRGRLAAWRLPGDPGPASETIGQAGLVIRLEAS